MFSTWDFDEMSETFQENFQDLQDIDAFDQLDNNEDIPLSKGFLDDFGLDFYQATTPGGLPSPNFSSPGFSGVRQEWPLMPPLSPFTIGFDSQPIDVSSGAQNGEVKSHFLEQSILKQSQESHTDTDLGSSNIDPFSQQMKPSMTGSSCIDEGQYQNSTDPSEDSLCLAFQSHAAPLPASRCSEQTLLQGTSTSPHVSIAPQVANNTLSASVPTNSPTSRSQHFVRYPSHLRNQIHPDLLQNSPATMTFTSEFSNRQDASVSLSPRTHQNIPHSSDRQRHQHISKAQNLSQGYPALQNSQPFQESNLRSSVVSTLGQGVCEAEQLQMSQYPDLQPLSQQQANRSPYIGHYYLSGSQGSSMNSHAPEQYPMQASSSRDLSSLSQASTDLGFNGSSPLSIKRELSSSDSPTSTSQVAASKPQKRRRTKQEPKDIDDGEGVVDPAALQTADLTGLDPSDHTNVETLIKAMHDMDDIEDNAGMQKTWEKMRKAKAFRIRDVCVDLLVS